MPSDEMSAPAVSPLWLPVDGAQGRKHAGSKRPRVRSVGVTQKPVFLLRYTGVAQEEMRRFWVRSFSAGVALVLIALALVACGGQAAHSEPEPTLAWDAAGLHVHGVYGPAVVAQQIPERIPSRWQLLGDGFLYLSYEHPASLTGRVTGNVKLDLTGDDTVVVLVDGEVVEPEQAWVEVDGEEVACLDCEVPHG